MGRRHPVKIFMVSLRVASIFFKCVSDKLNIYHPLVLLELRRTVKKISRKSQVYGTALHLRQFLKRTTIELQPTAEYVKTLFSFMPTVKNVAPKHYAVPPVYLDQGCTICCRTAECARKRIFCGREIVKIYLSRYLC